MGRYEAVSFVKHNGEGSVFTAVIGNTEIVPIWEIDSDFTADLNISYEGNSIIIATEKRSLINKSLVLTLNADGYDPVSMDVYIRSFI